MTLRMTVLCHETPFPPTHGGKADMWRRVVAMARAGAKLQIISWDYGELASSRSAAIAKIAEDHQYISLQRTLVFRAKHSLGLFRYPWFACIRSPGTRLSSITRSVRDFGPDLLFLDGWQGALLAFHLRDALRLPIYYRSHNIEHEYIRAQHKHATTLRSRLVTYVAGLHLQSFERKIMDNAAEIYDISVDDMEYWKARGYQRTQYLPPLFDADFSSIPHASLAAYDLVFFGNLHAPSNIAGVTWLVNNVMPIVWRERPTTTILIAGSNPDSQLRNQLEQINNVKILVNPTDPNEVLAQGSVALNPVPTAGGVQIKNIDMLLSGQPIITRRSSIMGLPDDVKKCFVVADSASDFASEILGILANPTQPCNKMMLNSYFGAERIGGLLQDIEHNLLHNRKDVHHNPVNKNI